MCVRTPYTRFYNPNAWSLDVKHRRVSSLDDLLLAVVGIHLYNVTYTGASCIRGPGRKRTGTMIAVERRGYTGRVRGSAQGLLRHPTNVEFITPRWDSFAADLITRKMSAPNSSGHRTFWEKCALTLCTFYTFTWTILVLLFRSS